MYSAAGTLVVLYWSGIVVWSMLLELWNCGGGSVVDGTGRRHGESITLDPHWLRGRRRGVWLVDTLGDGAGQAGRVGRALNCSWLMGLFAGWWGPEQLIGEEGVVLYRHGFVVWRKCRRHVGWCREGDDKVKGYVGHWTVAGWSSRCIDVFVFCGPLELTQTLLAGTGWSLHWCSCWPAHSCVDWTTDAWESKGGRGSRRLLPTNHSTHEGCITKRICTCSFWGRREEE